jgi:hypothetical protein
MLPGLIFFSWLHGCVRKGDACQLQADAVEELHCAVKYLLPNRLRNRLGWYVFVNFLPTLLYETFDSIFLQFRGAEWHYIQASLCTHAHTRTHTQAYRPSAGMGSRAKLDPMQQLSNSWNWVLLQFLIGLSISFAGMHPITLRWYVQVLPCTRQPTMLMVKHSCRKLMCSAPISCGVSRHTKPHERLVGTISADHRSWDQILSNIAPLRRQLKETISYHV